MLLVSNSSGTIANLDSDTFGYVALGTALLVFIGGGVLVRYRGQAGAMFRDAVTWLALGLALVTLYSYREELLPVAGRLAGELLPGSAMVVEQSPGGPVEIKIRKRLDVSKLSFTVPVMTANGRTVAARVRLDSVAIGPLQREHVDALVAEPKALTESLLGMSFLGRLRSYEFSGDFLTLRR